MYKENKWILKRDGNCDSEEKGKLKIKGGYTKVSTIERGEIETEKTVFSSN